MNVDRIRKHLFNYDGSRQVVTWADEHLHSDSRNSLRKRVKKPAEKAASADMAQTAPGPGPALAGACPGFVNHGDFLTPAGGPFARAKPRERRNDVRDRGICRLSNGSGRSDRRIASAGGPPALQRGGCRGAWGAGTP